VIVGEAVSVADTLTAEVMVTIGMFVTVAILRVRVVTVMVDMVVAVCVSVSS
jgi:hypothetical protein